MKTKKKGVETSLKSFRNRIKELKVVTQEELIPNEHNWRTHSAAQATALRRMLTDVGFVNPILTIRSGKKYKIVDGHLRAGVAEKEKVPIVVLDLTEEEARKVLATIDPITEMASSDGEEYHKLIDSFSKEMKDFLDETLSQSSYWNLGFSKADVPSSEDTDFEKAVNSDDEDEDENGDGPSVAPSKSSTHGSAIESLKAQDARKHTYTFVLTEKENSILQMALKDTGETAQEFFIDSAKEYVATMEEDIPTMVKQILSKE